MANYSYASLLVAVSGDTRQLANDIRDGASKAGADAAGQTSGAFNSGLRAVGGLGKDVGKAVATGLDRGHRGGYRVRGGGIQERGPRR